MNRNRIICITALLFFIAAASVSAQQNSSQDLSLEAIEQMNGEELAKLDKEGRLVYAILLQSKGQFSESRSVLEELVNKNKSFAEAWYNLALLEHMEGNAKAREKALLKALKINPSYAEAYAFKGNLAIAESNWEEAERNLKKALKYNKENPESLAGLAWVYANTDRLKESLPLLDKAIELDPNFVYARVDRSRVNRALRNYNAAEEDLTAVIDLEPDVPWHYLDRARIRLIDFRDKDSALADLKMVEKFDPNNFFALIYMAGIYNEKRNFNKAFKYFKHAVEIRPDYIWAYKELGKLYWMKGDYAKAAKCFAKAEPEDKDDFGPILMAGLAMERSGQKSKAKKLFSEYIKRYKDTDTEYEVIRFLIEHGNDFYAINALNKEENETLREQLWFYMGAVYEMEGNMLSSQSVYDRLADRTGLMEFDMAYAAINGMDG